MSVVDRSVVLEALGEVFDPELPVDIVSLGLVYRCDVLPAGRVEVDLAMTAPGCEMADVLREATVVAVREVSGVEDVAVEVVWDPPWSKERMSDAAKLQLGLL